MSQQHPSEKLICFPSEAEMNPTAVGCDKVELSFADGASRFENALNECSSPPEQWPAVGPQLMELNFQALFREVIKRGGHQKVTKEGKWDEIASALNIRTEQNLSSALGHHYLDQLRYFEENPPFSAPNCAGNSSNCRHEVGGMIEGRVYSKGDEEYLIAVCFRSKAIDGLLRNFADYRVGQMSIVPSPIHISNSASHENSQGLEIKISMTKERANNPTEANIDQTYKMNTYQGRIRKKRSESMMNPSRPRKYRNAYRIFFDKEYNRLKGQRAGSPPMANMRRHLNDKWKNLSAHDRQAFVEESMWEKEVYESEMEAYKRRNSMECVVASTECKSGMSRTWDEYNVLLETHGGEGASEACGLDEPATTEFEFGDDPLLHGCINTVPKSSSLSILLE